MMPQGFTAPALLPVTAMRAAWNVSAATYANPALLRPVSGSAPGIAAQFAGDQFIPGQTQIGGFSNQGPKDILLNPTSFGVWSPTTPQWVASIQYSIQQLRQSLGTSQETRQDTRLEHAQRSAKTYIALEAKPNFTKTFLDTTPPVPVKDIPIIEIKPDPIIPIEAPVSSNGINTTTQTYSLDTVSQVFVLKQVQAPDQGAASLKSIPFAQLTSPQQQAIVKSLKTNPQTFSNALFYLSHLATNQVENAERSIGINSDSVSSSALEQAREKAQPIFDALDDLLDYFAENPQQTFSFGKFTQTLETLGIKDAFTQRFLSDSRTTSVNLEDIPRQQLMEFLVDQLFDGENRDRFLELVGQRTEVTANSPRPTDVADDRLVRGRFNDIEFRAQEVPGKTAEESIPVEEAEAPSHDHGAGPGPQ